jgi:RNA polymerase sigma-70 factor, ECF subfamily
VEYSLKREENIIDDAVHGDIAEDDEALVRAAQKSPPAFTPLYRRYVTRVYRYVYSRVGNVHETEDLTAQVFTDAISALPKYQPQGNFAGWLFTFAYRRCADYHRKPTTIPLTEQFLAGAINDPVGQTEQQEIFDHLNQIMNNLDNQERELLRLHYAAKLSYREIANVLGRSEGAVKMAMSRLIHKMKAQWEVENE